MSQHPNTSARSGTATPTTTQTLLQEPSATLHLRASAEPVEREGEPSSRVRWAEDVIDNEGLGKKSSKVCCIYHKPHEPGDSESEDSSSSSSEDEDEPDLSRARKAGGKGRKGKSHDHDHDHGGEGGDAGGKGKGKERRPSRNAYERVPKHSHQKKDG